MSESERQWIEEMGAGVAETLIRLPLRHIFSSPQLANSFSESTIMDSHIVDVHAFERWSLTRSLFPVRDRARGPFLYGQPFVDHPFYPRCSPSSALRTGQSAGWGVCEGEPGASAAGNWSVFKENLPLKCVNHTAPERKRI